MESSAHRLNPANGRIHPTAGFVEVSIGDNGVGIAPENQEDASRNSIKWGQLRTGIGGDFCRSIDMTGISIE